MLAPCDIICCFLIIFDCLHLGSLRQGSTLSLSQGAVLSVSSNFHFLHLSCHRLSSTALACRSCSCQLQNNHNVENHRCPLTFSRPFMFRKETKTYHRAFHLVLRSIQCQGPIHYETILKLPYVPAPSNYRCFLFCFLVANRLTSRKARTADRFLNKASALNPQQLARQLAAQSVCGRRPGDILNRIRKNNYDNLSPGALGDLMELTCCPGVSKGLKTDNGCLVVVYFSEIPQKWNSFW